MEEAEVACKALSVIVPVFNKETSIRSCVESIMKGGLSESEFEVLLVDDGSTDGSAQECSNLQDEFQCVVVVSQANSGVSVARNTGICHAKGRYIAFLDADDEVSAGSLSAIVKTFDRYEDEADILTYPITYVDNAKRTERGHARQKWLNETGVYRLEEYPEICQTTINVCVKRNAALENPFPTSLRTGEDQLFNTRIAAEKAAIIFCADADYRYTWSGSGAASYTNHPLNAFEEMMHLYEEFLAIGESNPCMREYCNQMILYNFWWRLSSGALFPNFGSSEERSTNNARLARIARSIPAESYFQSKHLKEFQKPFLLEHFDILPMYTHIGYAGNKAYLFNGDDVVWETSGPRIRIVRCFADERDVKLFAYVRCPVFFLEDNNIQLLVGRNDNWSVVEIERSAYSICDAKIESTKAWHFWASVPIESEQATYSFSMQIGDSRIEVKLASFSIMRTNSRSGSRKNERVFESCSVRTKGGALVVSPRAKIGPVHELVRDYRLDSSSYKLRRAIRKERKRNGGRLWLYSDLPTSSSFGNALAQIVHDVEMQDGVSRYYATNCADEIEDQYRSLRGHLVEFGSDRHKRLFAAADTVLASYLDVPTFMPFDKEEWNKVGDLSSEKRLIYLQHGILHAHLPAYFSYEKQRFDSVVVSSQFEVDNFASTYHYPESGIIATGAPRLDAIPTSGLHERKILYAPSWRSYLLAGKAMQRIALPDRLLQSSFYNGFISFLEWVNQSGVLAQHGYTLDVKLHPNFAVYESAFHFDYPNVSLASDNVRPEEYAIMVTDYSSYLYDFLYAGSRILYYLPDMREFEGGANHYSRLDLPFEEGFGPFTVDAEEACKALIGLIEDCERDGFDAASNRASEFFLFRDQHNSARLYNVLAR